MRINYYAGDYAIVSLEKGKFGTFYALNIKWTAEK